MAKSTTLALVNGLMTEIDQAEIFDVSSAVGHAKVALRKLNDAIKEMYNKTDGRWYSLLTSRTFKSSFNAKITVVDYTALSTDTITITYNGTAVVLTEASEWTAATSNEVTATNIANAINAHASLDGITATALGNIVTARVTPSLNLDGITAVASSATTLTEMTVGTDGVDQITLTTDYAASYLMKDLTNNRIIISEWDKILDFDDPDEDSTGTPLIFSVRTDHLRLYPKPSSNIKIKEVYWKLPSVLSSNTDTYDLPEFCEAALVKIAEGELHYYLDKTQKGDRARDRAKILMEDAISTNDSILDRMLIMDSEGGSTSGRLIPPSLGSNFANPHGY